MAEHSHRPCPFCPSSDGFSYSTETGLFRCFVCEASPKSKRGLCFDGNTLTEFKDQQKQEEVGITLEPYYRHYRNIPEKIYEKFGVYFTKLGDKESMHYTYPNATKTRQLPKYFTAQGTLDHFFGQEDYNGGKIITITEGEIDRLSVITMMGDWPCVSVPSANPSKSFWANSREYLGNFEKIVLSIDNDEPGDALVDKFFKLFPGKVYRVNHGKYKDANEFLEAGGGQEYKTAWFNAQKVKPDNVNTTAEDFLKVYDETPNYEYFRTGIEGLDQKMLGIHKGAFTMVLAPTGLGKSLAPDTKVIKYDGSVVRADEVKVGDQLLGPDSTPRNVTNVNLQTGPMYKITPTKGDPWFCNEDHILSLKKTGTDEIKNVTILEYLSWSKTQKHLWKQWRTGGVTFGRFSGSGYGSKLAYCVGAYLGDGRKQGPEICMGKAKQSVIDFMMDSYLQPTRMKFGKGAYYIGFSKSSILWDQVKDNLEVRSIPDIIKYNTVDDRKHVLAGLLDTDGSVTVGGAEITQKSEQLSDDICFVARSLGLAAYKKEKVVNNVTYYRVHISGDLTTIPCKRLKFKPRKQKKDVLKTGFTVEYVGEGTYRGISLDGDHLFVMGDFTVTHNTEFFRYLENQCYRNSDYSFAFCHGEETELRSLLGLASYDLQTNVIRKDLIEEKGLDTEVRNSLKKFGESERLYQFKIPVGAEIDGIVDEIRFLATAMGVDFFFIEPIQDFVVGNTTEKENKLTDLANTMKRMASELNIGIIIIAHANEDGDAKYCKSLTQSAAYEIVLDRDVDSEDVEERNRTYVSVGRKNRTGGGSGPCGSLTFSLDSFTLTPDSGSVEPPTPKVEKKQITKVKPAEDDIPF